MNNMTEKMSETVVILSSLLLPSSQSIDPDNPSTCKRAKKRMRQVAILSIYASSCLKMNY